MKGLKLSVVTDEVSQDLEVAAGFAKRFNMDGVEIRTLWGKEPQQLISEIREIKKTIEKYGLKVSAIASFLFKCDIGSRDEYKRHIKSLRTCIDLAKSLDAGIVRGFTFWRRGELRENIGLILERFEKPIEIVEREGVVLAVENEPWTFIRNGRELALFLEKIDSKNVRALWDPANSVWDPSGERPYPDGYGFVRDKIAHIHIKDAKRVDGKPVVTAIGEGDINYRDHLKALIKDKYAGYLSLETHWRPSKRLSEKLLAKPGGAEFSEEGLMASEICMENFLRIMREAAE